MSDAEEKYQELVTARVKCQKCLSDGFVNCSVYKEGKFDKVNRQVGPYSKWQHSLHADVMLVGKDWYGTAALDELNQDEVQYLEKFGAGHWIKTNKQLQRHMSRIGLDPGTPDKPLNSDRLFFTNSVLCLQSETRKPLSLKIRDNCSEFLERQIMLVAPKVVVTLGSESFHSVWKAMRIPGLAPQSLSSAIGTIWPAASGVCLIASVHPSVGSTKDHNATWDAVARVLSSRNIHDKPIKVG